MNDEYLRPSLKGIPLFRFLTFLTGFTSGHFVAIQCLFFYIKFQTFLQVNGIFGQWHGDQPKGLKGHRFVAAVRASQCTTELAQEEVGDQTRILLQVKGQASPTLFQVRNPLSFDVGISYFVILILEIFFVPSLDYN